MDEDIKRDIDLLNKEILYYREKLEKEQDRTVELAKDIYTSVNKKRHDIFLNIIQSKFGVDKTEGDENPKDRILYELDRMDIQDQYESMYQRFQEDRFRNFNKTPDLILIKKEENKIASVDIIDVAVTFDPSTAVETKIDKYRPYLEMLKEYSPNIIIIYYSIRDKEIKHVGFPLHQPLEIEMSDHQDYERLCEETENIKIDLKKLLNQRDLEELNLWLRDSRTQEDVTGIPITENKFAISTEEFIKSLNDNKWFRRFFRSGEMTAKEKELLIRSFYYKSIDKSDTPEIDKFVKLVMRERPAEYKDADDNEKYFTDLENELLANTITFNQSKTPREPTNEEINSAFQELANKASNNFNGTERSKLLSPLYFSFSNNGEFIEREKGKKLKKRRLQNLYEKLKNTRGNSSVKKALMLILEPVNMKDEDYFEKFMKGELHVTKEGNVINSETFQEMIKKENKNIREQVKKGEIKPSIMDAFEYKKLVAVSMKKGEVISIRPSRVAEINELLDSAGINRKHEKTSQKLRKVKSMKFWDEKELDYQSEEFNRNVRSLAVKLIRIGENINEKEFEEFKPFLGSSDSSDSESSEIRSSGSSGSSKKSDEDIKKDRANRIRESFERGMKFYMRYNEILWENLSFAAHMGGNGFRIVQGITHNSFLIVMPCESILKGSTGVPFINVSIEELETKNKKGDIFYDHLDVNRITLFGEDFKIHISMGRRLDRPRLQGYMNIKPMFYTAVAILNHYRAESGHRNLDTLEQTMLALIIGNVNINTSSLLDNTRYMLENTMADYSFCKEFIEDKFMVACKNVAQMYLYSRVRKVLLSVREETSKARVKKSTISDDGTINIETSRVIKADISSYLFPDLKYKKPEFVIGEVYTLFFSIQKGLHGHFHNLLDTHKTPVEIQHNINKMFNDRIPKRMSMPEHRLEFNPKSMVLATIEADKNLTDSNRHIRQQYASRSRINETPLMIKTMTSTRSVMVEDKRGMSSQISTSELEINPLISELNSKEVEVLIKKIYDFNNKIENKKKNEVRKLWRKFVNNSDTDPDIAKFGSMSRMQTLDLIKNKLKVNYDTTSLEFRKENIRNDNKIKITEYQRNHDMTTSSPIKFYTSGTVLTQVLDETLKKRVYDEENNLKFVSQGFVSKQAVMTGDVKFLIRQKHQRTQKDREIFVGNKNAKDILYPLEHFYKQKCYHLTEEKISEPGDLKIISMSKQVRSGFEWMAREYMKLEKQKEAEGNKDGKSDYRCDSYHFNLDMTKWAPKDNVFKFIYTIAPCSVATFREKLFFIACIFKIAAKKLYIDDELFYKLMRDHELQIDSMDELDNINKEDDPFYNLTDKFTKNEIEIVETWFQGQMNYLSSYVHAGTLLLWKKFSKVRWSNVNMLFYLNCHSDDQQSDVYTVRHTDIEEKIFLDSLWTMMDFLMRNNCMEISIKKSYISKLIKQFISQYNIAGEQIYLWCKTIMSAISGCPYTTLKDDMSSMFSKVAEALSKGAPRSVSSIVINEMKTILWDIYGIRTKNQKNKFSSLMSIPEENLPMAFGGAHVRDYTTLAIGGPKTIDQMNLYHLVKKAGGTTEKPPTRVPTGEMLRSLQLFYITDLLTSETIEEEEDNSATLSLNPFRPTKFKSRRLGNEDPFKFNNMYTFDKESQIEVLKDTNPGLGLIKPSTPHDLISYYMILYNTPNFKSALAGQSPIILKLQKIINRKKGVFRFKKSGNITLEKFEDSENANIFTCEQVAKLMTSMMKSLPVSLEAIDLLRLKYIVSDPEFRVLAFTTQHAQSTSAVLRKNPIPKKKPNSSDYSNVVNKLNVLLCYFFDEEYFERNNYKIQFKVALSNDLMRINELFPVEFSWLRKQIALKLSESEEVRNRPSVKRSYSNYLKVYEEIRQVESDISSYNRMIAINDIRYRKHKELIDKVAEIEFVKAKGGYSADLEPTMTIEQGKRLEIIEKKRFDIFVRLVNCAKLISNRTQKIIFCAPLASNELHEITLATKTIIESSIDLSIGYYLSSNQRQELRDLRLTFFRAEKARTIDFIMQSANLLQLLYKTGTSVKDATRIMNSCKIKDINVENVKENFKDLYKKFQHASITMIGMKSPEQLSLYISMLDPIQIKWDVDQQNKNDPYVAHLHYENMLIDFVGDRGKVNEMYIKVSGQLYVNQLNKAVKSFCADLLFRDPSKRGSISLVDTLKLVTIDKNKITKLTFAISSLKNEIVEGNHHTAAFYMPAAKMTKSDIPKISPKIVESGIKEKPLGVYYKSTIDQYGKEETIQHRWFKDYQITELEFDDCWISGYLLKDLATKSMFRSVVTGNYMDLTTEEVIKFNRYPFRLIANEGTFGSLMTFRLLTSETGTGLKKIYNWIQYFFKLKEEYIRSNIESDEDSDGNTDSYSREVKDIFLESSDIVEFCNKFEDEYIKGNFEENQMLMDTKEDAWDDLMHLNSKYDLRSVRKAFIVIRAIQDKDKEVEEGINYAEMFNEMDIVKKDQLVQTVKAENITDDIDKVLISEAQLTKFNKYDQVMFNNIMCLVLTIYSQGRKLKDDTKFSRVFFEILKSHTDIETSRRAKRTNGMVMAVLCYHLGSKFLEFLEDRGKMKCEKKQTFEMLNQTYKTYKQQLSEHVITLWEIINNTYTEAGKKLINEATISQFDIVDRYQKSKGKGRKGKMSYKKLAEINKATTSEQVGGARPKQKSTTSKSIKNIKTQNPDLEEKSKDDPDALLQIASYSKEFDSADFSTDWTASETEASLIETAKRKKQVKKKSLLDIISEVRPDKPEVIEHDLDYGEEEYIDDEDDFDWIE